MQVSQWVFRAACAPMLVLTLTLSQGASAARIIFHDLTDTVTAEVPDEPSARNVCPPGNGIPEGTDTHCEVDLLNYIAAAPNNRYSAQFNLVDPAGGDDPLGTLSDAVTFEVLTGSTDLNIEFQSDPLSEGVLMTTPYDSTFETGMIQLIPLPPDLPALAAGKTVVVQAESDLGVSEPATLVLVGSGLLLLVAYRSLVQIRRSDRLRWRAEG
jgi:hypothetical protein